MSPSRWLHPESQLALRTRALAAAAKADYTNAFLSRRHMLFGSAHPFFGPKFGDQKSVQRIDRMRLAQVAQPRVLQGEGEKMGCEVG